MASRKEMRLPFLVSRLAYRQTARAASAHVPNRAHAWHGGSGRAGLARGNSHKRPEQGQEDVFRPVTDEGCLTALHVSGRAQEQIAAIREMAASAEDREVIDKLLDSAAARVRAKEEGAAVAAPQRVRGVEGVGCRGRAAVLVCRAQQSHSMLLYDHARVGPAAAGTGRSNALLCTLQPRDAEREFCADALCMLHARSSPTCV
jgi:hypothetical protein